MKAIESCHNEIRLNDSRITEINSNPLLSIIVPVYMVEKYLRRCLDSLVNQTYENVEIIIVDDGSTDTSSEICNDYAEMYDKITVYHKANGGLSDARNYGLIRIKGDIVGFVDSDDWIRVDMYQILIKTMIQTNADVVCCGSVSVYPHKPCESLHSGRVELWNKEEALCYLCEDKIIRSHVWSKIYRSELLKDMEFPKGKYYEDVFIMHHLLAKAERIAYVDEGLYYYYQREDSIIREVSWKNISDYVESKASRCLDLTELTTCLSTLTLAETSMLEAVLYGVTATKRFSNNRELHAHHRELVTALSGFSFHRVGDLPRLIDRVGFACYKLHVPEFYHVLRACWRYGKNGMAAEVMRSIIRSALSRREYVERDHKNLASLSDLNSLTRPRAVLMGSPEYGNYGDLAIAQATREFVRNTFPGIQYCEVSEDDVRFNLDEVSRSVNDLDVILLQGGGNMNELYDDQNVIRHKVIKRFPSNRIVIMPQSFIAPFTEDGVRKLRRLGEAMSRHGHISLFARDAPSLRAMGSFFDMPVSLVPDMVLSLRPALQGRGRHGIGICLREDVESGLTIDERASAIYQARACAADIRFISTTGPGPVLISERDSKVEALLEEFSSMSLLVTDRLHGVIFCAITGTPCVAIDTSNEKIQGIMGWLRGCHHIRHCTDVSKVGELCQELMSSGTEGARAPDLSAEFSKLATSILPEACAARDFERREGAV